MILHHPFFISARLLPAIKLGDATLTLLDAKAWRDGRQVAAFAIDLPDGAAYVDNSMASGQGGFKGVVEMFESYLGFLSAAMEGMEYELRTGEESENAHLFPAWLMQMLDKSDVEDALCQLTNEAGNLQTQLIEA